MDKHILVWAWTLIGTYYSSAADYSKAIIKKDPLAMSSLQASATIKSFYFKNDTEKEALNQKLKNDQSFRNSLRFDGLIIKHLDLSGMDLRDINFSGGTFIDVKFNNADLTGTLFDKSKLIYVDLTGVILDSLTLISGDHYQLVEQYSNLMKESKIYQARILNHLFVPLRLNLSDKNLQEFNLIGIDLDDINLLNAHLQKAILSEKVTVPDYPEDNRSELFNLWCGEDLEYQQSYQKLANTGFDLVTGVEHDTLIQGIQEKKELRNAKLSNAQLQGANLTGVNLLNAKLSNAQLQGTNLTEANLQNANLWRVNLQEAILQNSNLQNAKLFNAKLQRANLIGAKLENIYLEDAKLQKVILSEKVTLPDYPDGNHLAIFKLWCSEDPENQQACQKLVNAGFNITIGVDHQTLIEGIKLKKNLKNANLKNTQLQRADLTGADLQNANLLCANLQGANLIGAKLGGAQLSYTFKLPKNCKDNDLLGIYKNCSDFQAKTILKQILQGKRIRLE